MPRQHLTEEKLEKNIETVNALVELMPDPRRTQVKKMLDGRVGEIYFTAPASSKETHHSCYPGGLCEHSLRVVRNLHNMTKSLCPGVYSDAKLAFVGLFHDLGKVGDGKEEFYIPNPSDWHRDHGQIFEINFKCHFAPTSERGLYILQQQGIVLEFDEWAAIRLNDGQYPPENAPYKMKEPELAILTHFADLWSTFQEKSGRPE
jgi:hypothetical protein